MCVCRVTQPLSGHSILGDSGDEGDVHDYENVPLHLCRDVTESCEVSSNINVSILLATQLNN